MKKSIYALTLEQIEFLASENLTAQATTSRVGTTYLRVLVLDVQGQIGARARGRPLRAQSQLDALEVTTGKFYEAVLRGITTDDVRPDVTASRDEQRRRAFERNRRSAFARVSKSVLVGFIKAGGDMRTLDPETVTRDPLALYARQARGVSESGHQLERVAARAIRIARASARVDVDAARTELAALIAALQVAHDELSIDESQPTATQVIRTRPVHARMPEHSDGPRVRAVAVTRTTRPVHAGAG